MQDEKHRQDLEQAVFQLSASLKEDFNKIMADMKTRHEEEKAQMRKDFVKVKRDELDDLREKLAADYNIELKEMKAELEHTKFTEIAEVGSFLICSKPNFFILSRGLVLFDMKVFVTFYLTLV